MSLHPDFVAELRKRFSGDVRLDPGSRVLYSTDASIYQIEPLGVAIPKTQDDLHAAVELAAKHKIPILPRGAGTSLAGQAIGEALILDCSRWLDSIVEIDPESQTATVEPGVILADLNRAAAKHGLMYGPDPASAERATMGGVIANNATGAHSILYGMSADHLISADVILSDGSLATWGVISDRSPTVSRQSAILLAAREIREKYADAIKKNFPKSWRNSAGYRLNYLLPFSLSKPPQWNGHYPLIHPSSFILHPLLAGSEGTLAVISRAKVNLVRKPKHTILGILAYDNIASACDDAPRLLEFQPSAIELIPRMILNLARGVPAYARQMGWVAGDPAAVLAVEFGGDNPEALKDAVERIGNPLAVAESAEDQARVWGVRKVGLGILDSRPQAARPVAFIEDCAIPVERLGEFIREIERILAAHKTEGGIYAHASAGCLHIRPILNLQSGEGRRALRSIAEQTLALTLRLGGSMSSEHGDGIARGEWLMQTYGAEVVEAMRMLKRAADPYNLLNPGKMFDAPPMDSRLRFGENYQAEAWDSSLQFSHERGLAGAIEQCNGQGVCRKLALSGAEGSTGVMCPSYQATREESNSTRGRANLLRALISQPAIRDTQYAPRNKQYITHNPQLTDATFHALDLCLACKGCTSECPSGVDMPRLKYEFMHEYYESHRRPLRDYLSGYFHAVAKWLAPIAPLANAFMTMEWSRRLIARAMGITEARPFPLFVGRYTGKQVDRYTGEGRKKVIFLSDVFSRYLEPEVEQAALKILRAAGYEVKVLPVIGAGASLLSKGFIEATRRHAEKVLDAIRVLDAGASLSVVGCEPSEVYCLKREYVALLPKRRAEIESLLRRVWLAEEFLLRSGEISKLRVASITNKGKFTIPAEGKPNAKITFHPHCHQRAEPPSEDGLPTGAAATESLLRAFGFEVEVMDSGCCGMAGTFGYDAEHYELSMLIGELRLFPFLRQLSIENRRPVLSVVEASEIVSTGAACRLQIRHGAGKEAKAPLVLIAESLSDA